MARRRTLNYKELRAPNDEEGRKAEDEDEVEDEAEDEDEDEDEEGDEDESDSADDDGEGGDDEEEAPKPKKKKKKAPAKEPKPKRVRAAKVVRMKVVWKVFNNSNQPVATYEYPRKKEADDHAARLMAEKKATFFVQPVKEAMDEK